ncbi:DUF883 family protein [Rhizobiales bacterium]|uniref:DUF883 family protein n=1 Tax=Hongsoonwoonella zoysiae TaxID=2821844 RepID=UPI0015610405|nr:DUF883 family protein [Hongsoonwoonella zoysiae]NRG17948.1 DUF883 family protein [Hongsoonwoonella zoysiae]
MATASQAKKTTDGESGPTVADVEAQIRKVRAEIATLAETISAVGSSKAGELRGEAERRAAQLAGKGEDMVAGLEQELADLERSLKKTVREKPFISLGAALLAGVMAGLLLRR